MSSLRQGLAQGSLRTMKSKLDVFPLFVFIFSHVLTRKIGARKINFKFALMRKKIFLLWLYFYARQDLPLYFTRVLRFYTFQLRIYLHMYLFEIFQFAILTYKLSNKLFLCKITGILFAKEKNTDHIELLKVFIKVTRTFIIV